MKNHIYRMQLLPEEDVSKKPFTLPYVSWHLKLFESDAIHTYKK